MQHFIKKNMICIIIIANSLIFTNAEVFGTKFKPYQLIHSSTPQAIQQYGYPIETHTVQTKDGYLLKLHRIPHGKSEISGKGDRYPLLLCHELLGSSYSWVLGGPNKSLGFRLADEGYDVWLFNVRGNTYSGGHIKLTQLQLKYWDFSFHEVGIYDIPATIDYILRLTKHENLALVCHSMGTTAFYVMASTLPEYNHKVKAQISFAPIAAIPHTTSALLSLRLIKFPVIVLSNNSLLSGSFLPRNEITNLATDILCGDLTKDLCNLFVISPIFGNDPYQFDRNLIPSYFGHTPAGSSIKTLLHYNQLVKLATFQQFDYGKLRNMKIYGTTTPPKYNISNINTPIRVYYGDGDRLATPIDTRNFYQKLPKPMGLIRVKSATFNHIDFLGAININELLNDNVIQILNNATDPNRGTAFIIDTVSNAINHERRN